MLRKNEMHRNMTFDAQTIWRSAGSRQIKNRLVFLADAKLGYRPEETAFILGSVQLFDEMVAARWLQPVVSRHRLLLFDRGDISRAWARILNGEEPPRRERK